jgi:Family of unknown function (DUF6511)
MTDPDDWELAAIRAALPAVGELMSELGWDTRFRDLDGETMETLMRVAIGAYHDRLADLARGGA